MVAFSWLTAVSLLGIGGGAALPVPNAVPLVAPGSRFGAPDDCAVPALLVPGGGVLVCATEAAGTAAIVAIKTMADILVIGASPFMIQPAPGQRVPGERAAQSNGSRNSCAN